MSSHDGVSSLSANGGWCHASETGEHGASRRGRSESAVSSVAVRPFHSSRGDYPYLSCRLQLARDLDSLSETGISSNIGIFFSRSSKFESC